MNFRIPSLSTALIALSSVLGCLAASAAGVSENLENYLQLMLSEFNAEKVQIVNEVMNLSAEEAEIFWPIYRDYEHQLGEFAMKRAEAIGAYADASRDGTFDEAFAAEIADRYFSLQAERMDLLKTYHAKIEAALSAIHAAQFVQVEHQIFLFIDLAVAGELPPIGAVADDE